MAGFPSVILATVLSLGRTGGPDPSGVEPSTGAREGPEAQNETVARENWRMVVAGDVLIGVGMGAFGVMVAGLAVQSKGQRELDRLSLADEVTEAEHDEATAQRALGFKLAIAGGVSTAVLIGSGITLVAVGNRRERERREALSASAWGSGPRPWWHAGPTKRAVGINWSWRF